MGKNVPIENLHQRVPVQEHTLPIDTEITGLRQLDGEDTLLGTVYLFGVAHHAQFIRVKEDEETGEQVPTNDPEGRWEDVCWLYEQAYQTVEVPGFEGDYVLVIHPHAS